MFAKVSKGGSEPSPSSVKELLTTYGSCLCWTVWLDDKSDLTSGRSERFTRIYSA